MEDFQKELFSINIWVALFCSYKSKGLLQWKHPQLVNYTHCWIFNLLHLNGSWFPFIAFINSQLTISIGMFITSHSD